MSAKLKLISHNLTAETLNMFLRSLRANSHVFPMGMSI